MKKVKFIKSFFAIFLVAAMIFFSFDSVYAQDDDDLDFGDDVEDAGSSSDSDSDSDDSADSEASSDDENEALVQRTEKEWVEFIMSKCNNEPFSPFVSSKDPFKAIVEKKVIAPPQRVQPKVVKTNTAPQAPKAPPVKPIKITVSGIVGNDDQRLAIINFENTDYTVTKDQIIDGKFKVVDIQADRITVYSNKEQRRHSFKIGGES